VDAVSKAIGYAKFMAFHMRAVIRVYEEAGNVIDTLEADGASSKSG
jgi:ribulose kinase